MGRAGAQTPASPTDFSYATSQMDFKAKRVIPPSPEAAGLGTYGNIPISLFTGSPKVTVPLYELKGNALDLPISLSYNAGGFKPQDIASWVGLGWSLNAGGVITRSVVANPDNATNYFFANNNYGTPPPITNLFATYSYMDSIQKASKETQPDVYYYNFGNYSGKFFLGTNQNIIRKEKNDLKISCWGVPNDNTGSSYFTIVDEHGNTYQFATTEISLMQQNDAILQSAPVTLNYVYPSSWYLTSITSADGQEQINFNYYSASGSQTMYANYLQNSTYSYYHNSVISSSTYYESSSGNNQSAPPIVTITGRKYLQSITLQKGGVTATTINFESLTNQRLDLDHTQFPGEQLIQDIKVNSANGLVKKYNLYFSYFTNTFTDPGHKRLRLDSVSEAPGDGSGLYKPPYSFTYNNGAVPSTTQASVDHWGFFNGPDLVSTLVPPYNPGDGVTYGGTANRNPDFGSSVLTVLSQVNYPTGGYTTFNYELNQAKDPVSGAIFSVGGVRIKQMIDYSFAGKQAIVKNYTYTLSDGSPSGIAVIPIYTTTSTTHHNIEPVLGGCIPPNDLRCSVYDLTFLNVSASPVFGLGTIQGSHIGYSYVTESQTDINTGAALGKTVYQYNVSANLTTHDDNIANGDLLDQSEYDINGKLVEDKASTYNYTGGDGALVGYSVSTYGEQDNFIELCQYLQSGSTVYSWIGTWASTPTCIANRIYPSKYYYTGYTLSAQYKQLVQQTDTKVDQVSGASTVITKKYTYGNSAYTFPTLIEQYSSSSDEIVTSKKYAADYTVPTSGTLDNATAGIQVLQSKNMLGAEIETLQYRQNLDGSNKRYIDGTLNMYSPLFPYLLSIYRLELASPLSTVQLSSTNGTFTYDSHYQPLGSFTYDSYGNVVEQAKAQDVVKAYIWDYQHLLPTAEVLNANAYMVAYAGFETGTTGGNWSGYTPTALTAGGAAGSNSYSLSSTNTLSMSALPTSRSFIVSYWLHSGSVSVSTNIGAATGVAGVVYNGWTYYEHVLPANSTQVTLSSAAGANIDELRLFPNDALMTTYTYTPFVGMTSQSSSTNQFTYYEYDGFSRLVNIRDLAGNIVKNYKYNYGLGAALTASPQTLFYNNIAQQSFTKNNGCPTGALPTSVNYMVPFGKYVSSVSQADADSKAQTEISNNGQNNANLLGQCLWYNVLARTFKFKNNCTYSQGPGGRVTYTVNANTYSSAISQAQADSLAQADLTNNAQAYANANGTCTCSAEGNKYIAGTCQTGTRFNVSTTHMPDGTWQCVYYYSFSDGTVSGNYTTYSSTACTIQ